MTSLFAKCPHCGAPLETRFCVYCKVQVISPPGSKKRDREEESAARLAQLDAELKEQLALLDTQYRPGWRRRRALRAQQRTEAS